MNLNNLFIYVKLRTTKHSKSGSDQKYLRKTEERKAGQRM